MKIKIYLINILLFISFLSGNAFSKALPPGSGIGDVPANVLILLDRSGSMSARMVSGAGVYYPAATATDSNGDVFVMQAGSRGIKKFTYDTLLVDRNFASSGSFRGVTTGSRVCNIRYGLGFAIHSGNLYIADFYNHKVYQINISTGACEWKKDSIMYPRQVAFNGNIMYINHSGGLFVRNVSTNLDITSCSASVGSGSDSISRSYAMTVDSSGSNLYFHTMRRLNRHAITGDCPSTSRTSSVYRKNWRYSYGIVAHPTDDSIIYGTSLYEHKIFRYTMNAARTSFSSTSSKGTRRNKSSTASNTYIYYPYGLSVDSTNSRIAMADRSKSSVQFFDLNLGWIKELGGSLGTRMTGAHEAIQAIVSDPSLKAGVNFGFGWWSSQWRGGTTWFSGWNHGRDQARPCTTNNCLKVQVNEQGADKTHRFVKSVSPSGGTDAAIWSRMAKQYYLSKSHSPVDKSSKCQNSYVMVIGDGQWQNHSTALKITANLKNTHKIKTFTVAYGGGIGGSGITNFRNVAIAGGTNDVIIADTTASLKSQLKAAISQIIAAKLSFTAPAISATVSEGGDLFQAQFDYQQNKEWEGTLTRTAIDKKGNINTLDTWSASDMMPTPNSRNIWTVLDTTDYKPGYNNFVEGNWNEINGMFERLGNEVASYHSATDADHPANTTRCATKAAGVADGTDDDIKGLINFVRGQDYFDYDSDCNLTETRSKRLGDIYHSEMVVVGPPAAETAYTGTNQEAYWRSIKGYNAWAKSSNVASREKVIYVGANDGMLHAFKVKDGVELWGFIPPFVGAQMPTMLNANLNRTKTLGGGGSNAIYGVDGSPVVHDMYFKKPGTNSKGWYTILMVPYGRGGAGFSVLDVTNPLKPEHLYSIFNDYILKTVHFVDHEGNFDSWDYIATHYPLASFIESVRAKDNAEDASNAKTCNDSGTTQCYKSKIWTFPVRDISQSDIIVTIDQQPYTGFKVTKTSGGDTQIEFDKEITYYGYDPQSDVLGSTGLSVEIKSSAKATGLLTKPEYDYSKLGDTWSSPRIMRLPNLGRGDQNIEDDIYVAVMGGGYGAIAAGVGSNLTIVNLEDKGKVQKVIDIPDQTFPINNFITNSVPGSPVVITPDTARGLNFRGALVYTSDLEGKITKFNLTNMTHEGGFSGGKEINLYDKTIIFRSGSNNINQRYMFHSMDATIGQTTNSLWLYAGTGNYERIADKSAGVQNLLLGINDPIYPNFKNVPIGRIHDLVMCSNTTNDATGAKCPNIPGQKGWYIELDHFKKVTAEPTVSSGLVYFPIYKPTTSVNKCSLGEAFICGVDDECGTNVSSRLGPNTKSIHSNEKCKYVGQGVLSRIVTFAGKLFANIAGESTQDKKDLVQLEGASGDISTYRNSWRSNY